jgi:hypothetical protein
MGGLIAGRVDRGVPGAAAEPGAVAGAVAVHALGVREQVRAVQPAREQGHVMAARERLRRHVPAEEDGPAE